MKIRSTITAASLLSAVLMIFASRALVVIGVAQQQPWLRLAGWFLGMLAFAWLVYAAIRMVKER